MESCTGGPLQLLMTHQLFFPCRLAGRSKRMCGRRRPPCSCAWCTVQSATAHHRKAQHSAVHHDAAQYSTVQHSTTQPSTAQHSTTWCGSMPSAQRNTHHATGMTSPRTTPHLITSHRITSAPHQSRKRRTRPHPPTQQHSTCSPTPRASVEGAPCSHAGTLGPRDGAAEACASILPPACEPPSSGRASTGAPQRPSRHRPLPHELQAARHCAPVPTPAGHGLAMGCRTGQGLQV